MKNREAINWLARIRDRLMTTSSKQFEAITIAIAAMEKQEQDRWIPCKERLPEYGTEVLTQLSDDDVVVNWVIDEEDGEWFEYGVVAWRPLPEPYTEEES